jgi:hypothetical protein
MDHLFEGFDNIENLVSEGWVMKNNSDPLGTTGWFQGNSFNFPSQQGSPDAYISANYENVSALGTISNWLLTPTLNLFEGAEFSFSTRVGNNPALSPDRLQLRLSLNGSSMDVGNTSESVGDFSNLLIDINPSLTNNGYPGSWTQYGVTLTGLPAEGVQGRFGFRYFVTDVGKERPEGTNGDYIGIDTVIYPASIPCVHPDTKIHTLLRASDSTSASALGSIVFSCSSESQVTDNNKDKAKVTDKETCKILKPISEVRAGDIVFTNKGKPVPVLYNMRFLSSDNFIRIRKGALSAPGTNEIPTNDILIRKGHPILYNGREVNPSRLVGKLEGVEKVILDEPVHVWSLCTQERMFVLAEGVPIGTWASADILSKKKYYFDKY